MRRSRGGGGVRGSREGRGGGGRRGVRRSRGGGVRGSRGGGGCIRLKAVIFCTRRAKVSSRCFDLRVMKKLSGTQGQQRDRSVPTPV